MKFFPFLVLYFFLVAGGVALALGGPTQALHDKRLPMLLYKALIYPLILLVLWVLCTYVCGFLLGDARFYGATLAALAVGGLGFPTILYAGVKLGQDISRTYQPLKKD